jgi:uncharacterized protein (TIGR00266 family)
MLARTMADNDWYVVEKGKPLGPMTLAELLTRLPSLGGPSAMVFTAGMTTWLPAAQVPQVASAVSRTNTTGYPPPPPPPVYSATGGDAIEYHMVGNEIQYVEISLEPGQMLIGEPGFLMYMTPGVQMNTVLGDPSKSQSQGFLGVLKTAGARVLTGESAFVSTFTSNGPGTQSIAFAAQHPGKIIPFDLADHGGQIICQKDCFVCAARGVSIGIAFQKKIMTGLFGGEGFIMQRLAGSGKAMIAVGGVLLEKNLSPGETLKIDTGCLVAMESSINYDIQFVGGIRNAVFGGEGIFFATVSGPGRVWVQSLPFSRLAARVLANYRPAKTETTGGLLGAGLGAIFGNND